MRETTKFAGPLRECCELLRLEITLFSCFSFYYYYVNNRLDRFSGNNVVALHSSHKQHSTMSRFTLNDNQPKNTRNERTVIPHNSGNWYNRWWNITGTINATNGMLRIWFLSSRFVYLISGVRSIAWSDEKIELWSPVALYQANFSLLLLLLIFFVRLFHCVVGPHDDLHMVAHAGTKAATCRARVQPRSTTAAQQQQQRSLIRQKGKKSKWKKM